MKKVLKRAKMGWVYLFGIALMVGFSTLLLKGGDIGASGVNKEVVEQESTKTTDTAIKGISSSDISNVNKPAVQNQGVKSQTKPAVGATAQAQNQPQSQPNQLAQTSVAETVIPAKKDTVQMNITGLGKYTVEIKAGDTAFDALKRAASQNGFPIGYKVYSFGMMVSKIGSNESQGTYYWALYYNGSYSMVGSSDLLIKDKDIIEWRYESWM